MPVINLLLKLPVAAGLDEKKPYFNTNIQKQIVISSKDI